MLRLIIVVIIACVSAVLAAVPFSRAPGNGLMHSGHRLSTLGTLQAVVVNTERNEPANLAEYCAGAPEVEKREPIMADWKGYGTFYPGVVEGINEDGTIDVLYDDGWIERGVPKGSFKPKAASGKQAKKNDDAVCELAEDVTDIKEKLKDAEKNVAIYLASQRAAASANATAEEPAAPIGAAPAPASMSNVDGEQANKLQKLKDKLDAINEAIASTETKLESNAKVLEKLSGPNGSAESSSVKTVEDLIAQYNARISDRSEVLRKLKEQLRQQEQQMAAKGAPTISLEDIQADIHDMASDMENVKGKRDRLAKEDRLDPELRAAVDSMLAYGNKLEDRVEALFAARAKADAARKSAEAARAQAEAAKKAMEAAAKQADAKRKAAEAEAARKATEASKAAEDAAAEAAKQAFEAGEEVEKELKIVSKETETLDSGVHPNGNKWWRYRYEHSFVEALLMIVISALMLFYEKLFNWLRLEVYAKSHMRRMAGTMYTVWLEFASLQMLACLVVFLTIWLLDHCHVFNVLARSFHSSELMRLPDAGAQYSRLAFDICVCLIMALLFYFILMFSVVHASMGKMRNWAEADASELASQDLEEDSEVSQALTSSGTSSRHIGHRINIVENTPGLKKALTFYGSAEEFKRRKDYFLVYVAAHPTIVEKLSEVIDPRKKLSQQAMLERFPFWKYLRANVRKTMDSFLELSSDLWLGVIGTFVLLLFLHHFLHLGYIRVMAFFLLVQCATLGLSMFMIYKVNSSVEFELGDDLDESSLTMSSKMSAVHKSLSVAWHIKQAVIFMLQYTLFFLCYGAARSICQPWMWKLHFWLVLGITIVSAVLTVIFISNVSPLMTTFAASMAMPPYIDPQNLATMEEVIDALRKDSMSSKEFAKIQ